MLIHDSNDDMFHRPAEQQGFKIGAVPASQGLNPQAGRFFFGGEFVLVVFCITFKATRNKGRLADVGNIPFLAFALEAFLFNSSFKNSLLRQKMWRWGG